MAKKKTKIDIRFLIIILSLIVTLLIIAPALGYNDAPYSGLQVTFGTTITDASILGSVVLKFNIFVLLSYLLPIIAVVSLLFFKKKYSILIAFGALVLSAILLFIMPSYVDLYVTLLGKETAKSVDWVLQWGLVISGVISSLAALLSLYQAYLIYKK